MPATINRKRDHRNVLLILFCSLLQITTSRAQLPKPDHVVIVMFQNKGYSQIAGSPNAPYINSLLADTNAALFTQSYALTHPSQPNYLMLYSGSTQGVTTDAIQNTPFTTCNLGASLLAKGLTFAGYSESMPYVGYLGDHTDLYYRKHNPWSDWQGSGTNSVPSFVNQPFSAFPLNFSLLPQVSFVVGNIINCMHDGTIKQGDSWLQANLETYRQWALNNNSLLIVTFDEDNGNEGNHILTLFYGPMVNGGSYNSYINHYNVLRTLEHFYSLENCGNSASAAPINYVWKNISFGIEDKTAAVSFAKVFPNPAKNFAFLSLNSQSIISDLNLSLVNIFGQVIFERHVNLKTGNNELVIEMNNISSGVYFARLTGQGCHLNQKIVITD